MSKGLDSAKSLANHTAQLNSEGYGFVARYLFRESGFKEHITVSEVDALHAAGISLVTVWEDGRPTESSYFTALRGTSDGTRAAAMAKAIGQPLTAPVYFAADYDANPVEVETYFAAVQKAFKAQGFASIGAYANGAVLADLTAKGIISHAWLSQSTGWRGFDAFKSRANIVQLGEFQFHGIDVDADVSNGHGGGW